VSTESANGAAGGDLVLAVDGGNAKTDLALLDASGALLSLVRGAGSSTHGLGIEGAVEVLEGLLEAAVVRAGLDTLDGPVATTAQMLLAGADLPEEQAALLARIERQHWSERLVVDNDTLALLRAGTDRGWGVAVVCGAGINCIGVAPDHRQVRFPALGAISGDWGGGGDVGLAALMAAARGADGRGPRTVLETAVPEHFGLSTPLDVSRAFHLMQLPLPQLGELAPVVLAAYEQDEVAAGIIGRLADEVVAFARATLRRLELTALDPDVVLGGRLLKSAAPTVIETITQGVAEVAPDARVVVSPSEPIVGAALLGLDALGVETAAGERARTELDEAVRGLASSASAAPYITSE
jgi:N-acetylglucosamine kinase-like BadF-type ATPase